MTDSKSHEERTSLQASLDDLADDPQFLREKVAILSAELNLVRQEADALKSQLSTAHAKGFEEGARAMRELAAAETKRLLMPDRYDLRAMDKADQKIAAKVISNKVRDLPLPTPPDQEGG